MRRYPSESLMFLLYFDVIYDLLHNSYMDNENHNKVLKKINFTENLCNCHSP